MIENRKYTVANLKVTLKNNTFFDKLQKILENVNSKKLNIISIKLSKQNKNNIYQSQNQTINLKSVPLFFNLKMNNAFQYYQQLRKQQIHYTKIINPEVRVPKHQAYKPIKAKIQQARLKQRLKQEESIQRQNAHIMKKLFTINMRKPKLKFSDSTPNFSLPPIVVKKKAFEIPEHQQENNIIAQKLINSKSSINVKSQLRDYNEKERIKKSLSKYHSLQGQVGSQVIDRKKYIAELMLLKKMKTAEQTKSRLRQYITSNNANSRVQRFSSQKRYHSRK